MTALALVTAVPAFAGFGDLVPPKVNANSPTGVSLADGSLTYSQTDLSIGTLQLERFFVSDGIPSHTLYFGSRMSHNFDIYVARTFVAAKPPFFIAHHKLIVHMGAGASGVYSDLGTTPFDPDNSEASAGKLALSGTAYVYTDLSGVIYTFNPSVTVAGIMHADNTQRISTIKYPNGRLQNFTYNSSGQLKVVSDSGGYALVFDYGTNGAVSAACGYNLGVTSVSVTSTCTSATLKVGYGYTGTTLINMTDVTAQTTGYDWTNGFCIKPPGYATCKVDSFLTSSTGWGSTLRVLKQDFIGGTEWNYGYDGDYSQVRNQQDVPEDADTTTMTDPDGNASNYYFLKSTLTRIDDTNGNTSYYHWLGGPDFETINPPDNEGSILDKITFPEGNQYLETHSGFNLVVTRTWKAKPGSGLPDLMENIGYGSCPGSAPHPSCTQPLWTKDPNGNETDYVYDSAHGGVLQMTLPADKAGLRKRTYTTYTSSSTTSGATIYRPTRAETCALTSAQLTLTTCPSLATTMVTTTTYYADTFMPLIVTQTDNGSTPQSMITTYAYDDYGNTVSVDGPLTGAVDQSFRTYDLAHRVVCEIGPDPDGSSSLVRMMVRHTYDIDGRETLTEQGTGTSTTTCLAPNMAPTSFKRMTYDGMDRVVKTEVGMP